MKAARGVVLLGLISTAHASHPDAVPSTLVEYSDSISPNCAGCTVDTPAGTHSRTYQAGSACDQMKVHFSAFSIPSGAKVSVCGADRSECYTYHGDNSGTYTVDKSVGEDGQECFGAMSVDGTEVIVTLTVPPAILHLWDAGAHAVTVKSITEIGEGEADASQRAARAQSVCGAPGYRDVMCYRLPNPIHYRNSRAVARLLVGMTGASCTAWRLTTNNLMITNEHCLGGQEELQSAEVQFNFQRAGCGRGTGVAVTVKVTAHQLLTVDEMDRLDFALFRLTEAGFERVRQFGWLSISPDEPRLSTRIYIPQHPSGERKQLAIVENTFSGFCEIRDMHPQGNRDWAHYKMGYRCDTQGGSSGAPIIRTSDHMVVGLHSNAGCAAGAFTTGTNKGTKISHIRLLLLSRGWLTETGYPTQWPGTTAYPRTRYPSSRWPTHWPGVPSRFPSGFPSTGFPRASGPTEYPTGFPSMWPTGWPVPSGFPSRTPTGYPSGFPKPTGFPSRWPTGFPSRSPIVPTGYPTFPTRYPAFPTGFPTQYPLNPSGYPTGFPRPPTGWPSRYPTRWPTGAPLAAVRTR
eukprot:TRINITY_DN50132_c0_g1_i1.p1 TRINITY_DN50132_c0_g1~~TRINITY_DN50132_c0_g1_i1.p1  ORF type:complete len:607 (+),score=69.31 TRINITY_DN50132_c0_g1_i1:100-1821(+)